MVYAPGASAFDKLHRERMQEECDRWPPKLWKPSNQEEQAVNVKHRSLNRTQTKLSDRLLKRSMQRGHEPFI
jgi:hypothetical protein